MLRLVIYVECKDPSDLDYLRARCHGAVIDVVDTAKAEERLDGEVDVGWDIEEDD